MAQGFTKVTDTTTFAEPLDAVLNGQPVRIIALGDQEGSSPVYLSVDDTGHSRWVPIAQVQITDSTCRPMRLESLIQDTHRR